MMELRQLQYFISLSEELHFGRAADREHIAQPAFSQQIKRLEQQLGVQLFDRSSRHVRLTEPGRVLVEHAREILGATNDAMTLVRQAGHGKHGRIRVAYSNGTDRGMPPEIVDRFRSDHPRVELNLSVQYDEQCWVQLRNHDIDAAFYWMPMGSFDDFEWQPVVSEPLVVAIHERHPLVTRCEITAQEVAAEPLVWIARDRSPGWWDKVIGSVFFDRGLTPNICVEEASHEGMVREVALSLGVTIITASTARQHTVDGVVYRPFADPAPTADIGIAWRADESSPLVRSLAATASDVSNLVVVGAGSEGFLLG
jgi:LysR family transcriptional regulator, benzoate and cis,cis-muconate-responsive activator of ben and cat genes